MEESRYEELRQQALRFHRENPHFLELFEQFTFDRISKGFRHYSAYAIFEQIRWHTDFADESGESTFKLNNNYRPFYARAFMNKHPEYEGFFRLRKQTSKNHPATGVDEFTPDLVKPE